MKHSTALEIAERWVHLLEDSCDRIEIAGSVRRLKPEVHDIEIVAMPVRLMPIDLFGHPGVPINYLESQLHSLELHHDFEFVKNGPKYKQLALPEGINLDLFLVTPPAQWGVIFLIRTGPKEFSEWMVTPRAKGGALPGGYCVQDGTIRTAHVPLPDVDVHLQIAMPNEADFFAFCGLEWIEPKDRQPRWRNSGGSR